VEFQIDDAEQEWDFSTKFDYIHGRALISCFIDPRSVWQQAFDTLNPGGWFEMQEPEMPMAYLTPPPPDSPLKLWNDEIRAATVLIRRPWDRAPLYKGWFEEIGFEEVTEKRYWIPMNPWPKGSYYKTVGTYALADFHDGIEAASAKLLSLRGWKTGDIAEFVPKVQRDLADPNTHAYMNV
jgi:hypothetical protein